MCGISGIIGKKANKSRIDKMTKLLKHRGYNNIDCFVDKDIALGHNRLSIIDLTDSSNQPFYSPEFPFILIFNGEIYNYREIKLELISLGYIFRTNSDTEVLYLSYCEWKENCLNKFNGMFSFAIWDKQTRKLFAARDRFGVKPFYYHYDGESLFFSSEIKAISEFIDFKLNNRALANYLIYGSYGMPNETFYDNIIQLPAGHYLTYFKNNIIVNCWYDFIGRVKSKIKNNASISQDEAKKEYIDLLKKSISLRFRSDVPVGFTLSGGVDSSLLLSLVNKREDAQNIKAYTFYTNNSKYDELPWVMEMVKETQTILVPVLFEPKDFKFWHNLITNIQDEPYGGIPTLAYAKLLNRMEKDGIKVVLDGQGMDEAWAGYDYYQTSSNQTIQGQKGKTPFKTNVLTKELTRLAQNPEYPRPFNDELLNKQYRDLFYTKIPRVLRFNDRASMASTTELREPFLDYKLVEYAFSLPKHFKIQNGIGKYLLRKILADFNNNLAFSPKRALQTPQREWLGNELKAEVEEALSKIKNSNFSHFFKFDEMKKEWKKYKEGNQTSSFHIWQWISISDLIIK